MLEGISGTAPHPPLGPRQPPAPPRLCAHCMAAHAPGGCCEINVLAIRNAYIQAEHNLGMPQQGISWGTASQAQLSRASHRSWRVEGAHSRVLTAAGPCLPHTPGRVSASCPLPALLSQSVRVVGLQGCGKTCTCQAPGAFQPRPAGQYKNPRAAQRGLHTKREMGGPRLRPSPPPPPPSRGQCAPPSPAAAATCCRSCAQLL